MAGAGMGTLTEPRAVPGGARGTRALGSSVCDMAGVGSALPAKILGRWGRDTSRTRSSQGHRVTSASGKGQSQPKSQDFGAGTPPEPDPTKGTESPQLQENTFPPKICDSVTRAPPEPDPAKCLVLPRVTSASGKGHCHPKFWGRTPPDSCAQPRLIVQLCPPLPTPDSPSSCAHRSCPPG